MNKVLLIGNLTKSVEVRYTTSDLAIASFSIAVKREIKKEDGTYDADFINCVAYGKQAETISKYLDKGSSVAIEGRIQTGSYENKEGKKVYTTDVVVEKITFVNTKKKEETKEEPTKSNEDPYEQMGKQVEAEADLPF